MAASDAYQRLTSFLSFIVIVSNLAAIHLYRYIPDDPLHIRWHLSLYSYFAVSLGIIGFFGARKSNATLVSIFSNYLLIDIVISAIPKLIAVTLLSPVRASLCSTETIHAWIEYQTESSAIATDETLRREMTAQCLRVVGVMQMLMATFVSGVTIIQTLLVLRVSAYARSLCRKEDLVEKEASGGERDVEDGELDLMDEKSDIERA